MSTTLMVAVIIYLDGECMVAMGRGSGKTPDRVVERIKAEVARLGQNATAKAIKIPLYSVQKYLDGNTEPTTATLEKLADYFGLSVAFLRGDDNDLEHTHTNLNIIQDQLNSLINKIGGYKYDELKNIEYLVGEIAATIDWNIIYSNNSLKNKLEQRIIDCYKKYPEILSILNLVIVKGKDNLGFSQIYGEIKKGKIYLVDKDGFPGQLFEKFTEDEEAVT